MPTEGIIREVGITPLLVSDRPASYWGVEVQNSSGRVAYVQTFDAASPAEVTVGVTQPVIEIGVPPSPGPRVWLSRTQSNATRFSRGIVIGAATAPFRDWSPGYLLPVLSERVAGVHVCVHVDPPVRDADWVPTVAVVSGGRNLRLPAGYGDILQALQCLGPLAARYDHVLLIVPPALDALVRSSTAHLPSVQVWCTGSNGSPPQWGPITYRTEWGRLVWDVTATRCRAIPQVFPPDGQPHLVVPEEVMDAAITREPGRHIGICWSASAQRPARSNLLKRALALATLATPLLAIPGVVLHSLQVGPATAELDAFPSIRHYEFGTFMDTARVAVQLEAIVSVDTSVCHLAGGLGVPTLLVLSTQADLRWGRTGTESEWYRSMRIVRQPTPGDWGSAVAEAAHLIASGDLPPRLAPPAPARLPCLAC